MGDDSSFLQGMAVAAGWLLNEQVDGCLVVGAEEADWLVADAARLFNRAAVQGAGAGAIYFRRDEPTNHAAELVRITDEFSSSAPGSPANAAREVRAQLLPGNGNELLCMGTHGIARIDAIEDRAWRDWTGAKLAPKRILGEAFTASAAWQCVAAGDAVGRGDCAAANVSIFGASRQAIGARFVRAESIGMK